MKKKNISGIVLVASVVTLLIMFMLIRSQADMVKASYVKLGLVNLVLVVCAAGIYLVDVFKPEISSKMKMINLISGIFIVTFSFLVSFNLVSFLSTYNWLIVFGIFFILLIQLQLLNWGKRVPQIVRFSALFIMLADAFLIFFFIAKWKDYHLASPINIAAAVSFILTFVGVILLKEKKEVVG